MENEKQKKILFALIPIVIALLSFFALVLKVKSEHDSPTVVKRVEGIHTQHKVRAQAIAVHLSDSGRHSDRSCSTQIISSTGIIAVVMQ